MNTHSAPDMSVILATPDDEKSIRKTIQNLRQQTVLKRLEIVIIAPSKTQLNFNQSELEGFFKVLIVECGAITSIAQANAAGIRRATAPIVALAEDHSFPMPDWAEALIEAHRRPYAAVGPVTRNANPNTAVSWADFLIGYGPWIDPTPAGIVEFLPGHNSSYKRAILLECGDKLEAMLEAETVLHWELRKKGHELYLEPAAKTAHVNFSLLSSWLRAQYHCGRVFAGTRLKTMSAFARLVYIGGAPLIPLVRLRRILRELHKPARPQIPLLQVIPTLLLGLSLDGLGQMIGYLCGIGKSKEKLAKFEFHRLQHLTPRDKKEIQALH
jgi:GT2 family glycosyltransferase